MENALKFLSQLVTVALQLSPDQVKEASYQSQTVNEITQLSTSLSVDSGLFSYKPHVII